MTTLLNLSGNLQQPIVQKLTNTSRTVIGEAFATDGYSVVEITVINPTASTATVTLEWNDGSTDRVFWIGDVPAKTTVPVPGVPFKVREGQSIKATGVADVWVNVVTSLASSSRTSS